MLGLLTMLEGAVSRPGDLVSLVPPTTPAEALARAQLLLDYPPTADKIDEWRATIQSLISFANGDTPRQPSTSLPRQDCQARADGDKTGGGATTVHSPPRRPRSPTHRVNLDTDSIASSDPRARRDQRQVLQERQQEDARTRIVRRPSPLQKGTDKVNWALHHPFLHLPKRLRRSIFVGTRACR